MDAISLIPGLPLLGNTHLPVVHSIELGGVPAAGRAALSALTSDLYPAVQIGCAFAEVPEPGECMRDPQWHAQVRST